MNNLTIEEALAIACGVGLVCGALTLFVNEWFGILIIPEVIFGAWLGSKAQ